MILSARIAGDLMRRQIHYLKWKRLRDQIHCLLKNLGIFSLRLVPRSFVITFSKPPSMYCNKISGFFEIEFLNKREEKSYFEASLPTPSVE